MLEQQLWTRLKRPEIGYQDYSVQQIKQEEEEDYSVQQIKQEEEVIESEVEVKDF
jgi:hypothetical protein